MDGLNVTIESTMDKKYLVIQDVEAENVIEYQLKMLRLNKISGLIPIETHIKDSKMSLYYDITYGVPIKDYFKDKKVHKEEYIAFISSIINKILNAYEYLLEDSSFLLLPDYIYVDKKDSEPYLIYLPLKLDKAYDMKEIIQYIGSLQLADDLLELSTTIYKKVVDGESNLKKLKYILREKDKVRHMNYKEEEPPQVELSDQESFKDVTGSNNKMLVILIQVLFLLVFVFLISSGLLSGDFFKLIGMFVLFGAIDAYIIYRLNKNYSNKTYVDKDIVIKDKSIKGSDIKKEKYNIAKKIVKEGLEKNEEKSIEVRLYKEKDEDYLIFTK